jgi:N-acetylglucosaminyldiphosphoundecaprenol N-acetyl-beta-D-mannosaminyltransferase
MWSRILNYNIYALSKKELLNKLFEMDGKVIIISGNPEILYNGLCNRDLNECFIKPYSIIIPDGIGVVLASRIVKQPVSEKIPGIEVMQSMLKECAKRKRTVYLLGATMKVLKDCAENIKRDYPELEISGKHHGYFNIDECSEIIEDIIKSKADILFVAMGCPRQELFIHKYFQNLPCKVLMGVGGSFDVFAGKINRAPKWMIKLGLEWLYRVYKEPVRLFRLIYIPKFLIRVAHSAYIMKK